MQYKNLIKNVCRNGILLFEVHLNKICTQQHAYFQNVIQDMLHLHFIHDALTMPKTNKSAFNSSKGISTNGNSWKWK